MSQLFLFAQVKLARESSKDLTFSMAVWAKPDDIKESEIKMKSKIFIKCNLKYNRLFTPGLQ